MTDAPNPLHPLPTCVAEPLAGVDFDFGGGRILLLPPLTIGSLQRLQAPLAALSDAEALAPASLATIAEAALAALRRNYPTITMDQVVELIDIGNMFDVVATVLDVSGLRRKAAADAKNPPAQPTPVTPAPTGPAS